MNSTNAYLFILSYQRMYQADQITIPLYAFFYPKNPSTLQPRPKRIVFEPLAAEWFEAQTFQNYSSFFGCSYSPSKLGFCACLAQRRMYMKANICRGTGRHKSAILLATPSYYHTWQSERTPRRFLFPQRCFLLSARKFSLSDKRKSITKFVTLVTKLLTHITKFVIHVTKFVTKTIL